MTSFELLSLLVAILAIVISAVSLVRTRKTENRQLELQEEQAKLAAFQHKVLAAEQVAARQADLRVTLVRAGMNSYFEFSNVGSGKASDVMFAFAKTGPRNAPVVGPQFSQIFPKAEFLPNESIRLQALVSWDTPGVLEGEYTWRDAEGITKSRRLQIA